MPVATIADLPLELVETIACHLDVKDVAKLMRVNKRLYSSYATDQSIVFGKHVAVVSLGQRSELKNGIKKFVDSPSLQLNATLLPFAKRIDSCDKLECFNAERPNGMSLDQLKFVNQLEVCVGTKEECVTFLTSFRGSVKKNATVRIKIDLFEQDEAMKEQFDKFFKNQLNRCEKITLDSDVEDWLYACYEAMMKTQIKMISIETWKFDQVVDWIVNQGMPSTNSEVVIYLLTRSWVSRVGNLFSQVQGLQRVDDSENHSALVSRANQLLRENDVRSVYVTNVFVSDENSTCFRHRIDATTSWIYVFCEDLGLFQFLAFYMPSQ